MRFLFALLLVSRPFTTLVIAFSSHRLDGTRRDQFRALRKTTNPCPKASIITLKNSVLNEDNQGCDCEQTIYSGKPLDIAMSLNHREAIRDGAIFDLNSEEVRMDDLLENRDSGCSISIVVFLRSLG